MDFKKFSLDNTVYFGDNYRLYTIVGEKQTVFPSPPGEFVTDSPNWQMFTDDANKADSFVTLVNFVVQRRLVVNKDGRCYSRVRTADTGDIEGLFFYGVYNLKQLTMTTRLVSFVNADAALTRRALVRLHFLRALYNDGETNEKNLELIAADSQLFSDADAAEANRLGVNIGG